MIVLSFVFDDWDISETKQFMNQNFATEGCKDLGDWIPRANIAFSIDDVNMGGICSERKLPVLEFAVKLNEIVHTITVGEKRVISVGTCGDYSRFLLVDEQTLEVEEAYKSDSTQVTCLLSDMQAKSELFCSQLYEQILKLFPGYFEMMDRLPAGAEAPLESASERNIRRLFLRGSSENDSSSQA